MLVLDIVVINRDNIKDAALLALAAVTLAYACGMISRFGMGRASAGRWLLLRPSIRYQ
jgi:hypothetical protein